MLSNKADTPRDQLTFWQRGGRHSSEQRRRGRTHQRSGQA